MTSDGPAITTNTLCAACVQAIQKCLDELPHLAVALRAFLGVTPKTALQSKVRSTPEPACPLDPRVDQLLTDIWDVIDRTDGLKIIDLIRQPAMKFVIWMGEVRRELYLAGWERALDIRRVHARANKIIGFEPEWRKRHAPCPQCGESTLGHWVGDDNITCTGEECGLVLSPEAYDMYCKFCMELYERMRNEEIRK